MTKQTNNQNKNNRKSNNKKTGKSNSSEKGNFAGFLGFISNGITPYIIIVIIISGVYFQTTSYGLTGLDDDLILKNVKSIITKDNIMESFKTDAILSYNGGEFYRPIQGLSFIFDAKTGNTNLFYFHFTNFFIHIIACCLLLFLLILLGFDRKISFFLTLIFSSHPFFNQAVIWLPSRGDLLVSMFGLISFISYIKFSKTKNYLFFLLNILSFFLAVYSKEIAVLLPAIFVLYDLLNDKKVKKLINANKIILIISWLVIIATYIFMRADVVKVSLNSDRFGLKAFIHNLPVIPEFLSKFVFPFNLNVLPEFNLIPVITGLLIMALFVYLLIKQKNIFDNFAYLFIGWFILFTVTAMFFRHEHLDNAYDYLEHRAYMPLMGFVMLISSIRLNKKTRNLSIMIYLLVFIVFTGITLSRANIFKDSQSFYSSAIEKGTKVVLAYNNRGLFRHDAGDKAGAQQDYNRAIELKPDYAIAFNNRGNNNKDLGNIQAALQDYNKAIYFDPNYSEAYNNRANIKDDLGDEEGSMQDYNRAVSLKPDYTNAILNRGGLFLKLKNYNSALSDFKKVLELSPDNYGALNNFGVIYEIQGNLAEASKYYERVLNLYPNNINAIRNAGVIRLKSGDKNGACEIWKKAAQSGSKECKDLMEQFCK